MNIDNIIYILVLIYSIILHEIAHGYVAYREGDNTAKWAGRLTLNPLPHIDIIGSIIVPIATYISTGGAMGWAKGVPYNPHMLRGKYSEAKVAAAGVITNFLIATISAFILYFSKGVDNIAFNIINYVLIYAIIINISLGIFNLLPLPPFDGLRIITSLFPNRTRGLMQMIDNNATVYLLVSVYIAYNLFAYISPLISYLVSALLTL